MVSSKHSRNLIISGTICTIVLFLWPTFMLISSGAAGTIEEKLQMLSQNATLYHLNFMIASLIAPSILFLICIVSRLYKKMQLNFFDTIGVALLVAYSALNALSYISQYSILPKLLANGNIDAAKMWYMENTDSLAYFFNQLGYCFFGIAVMFIFREFLNDKGINKTIGILFYLSGVLSIFAFIGLLMQNKVLNLSTMLSGLLIIPIAILTILSGIKD